MELTLVVAEVSLAGQKVAATVIATCSHGIVEPAAAVDAALAGRANMRAPGEPDGTSCPRAGFAQAPVGKVADCGFFICFYSSNHRRLVLSLSFKTGCENDCFLLPLGPPVPGKQV